MSQERQYRVRFGRFDEYIEMLRSSVESGVLYACPVYGDINDTRRIRLSSYRQTQYLPIGCDLYSPTCKHSNYNIASIKLRGMVSKSEVLAEVEMPLKQY